MSFEYDKYGIEEARPKRPVPVKVVPKPLPIEIGPIEEPKPLPIKPVQSPRKPGGTGRDGPMPESGWKIAKYEEPIAPPAGVVQEDIGISLPQPQIFEGEFVDPGYRVDASHRKPPSVLDDMVGLGYTTQTGIESTEGPAVVAQVPIVCPPGYQRRGGICVKLTTSPSDYMESQPKIRSRRRKVVKRSGGKIKTFDPGFYDEPAPSIVDDMVKLGSTTQTGIESTESFTMATRQPTFAEAKSQTGKKYGHALATFKPSGFGDVFGAFSTNQEGYIRLPTQSLESAARGRFVATGYGDPFTERVKMQSRTQIYDIGLSTREVPREVPTAWGDTHLGPVVTIEEKLKPKYKRGRRVRAAGGIEAYLADQQPISIYTDRPYGGVPMAHVPSWRTNKQRRESKEQRPSGHEIVDILGMPGVRGPREPRAKKKTDSFYFGF